MLPFELTDSARERIEQVGKATMTFRVWAVMHSGHLAIEVFFEDMRSPEIEYKKFQDKNVIAYIPTNHYDFIRGVTVDFSGWDEEYEVNYSHSMTFNHRGFECLPHQVETSEIRLSWFEVNEVIKKLFWMNYLPPYCLHRQAAASNYLRVKKAEEAARDYPKRWREEELKLTLFSLEELGEAIQIGLNED